MTSAKGLLEVPAQLWRVSSQQGEEKLWVTMRRARLDMHETNCRDAGSALGVHPHQMRFKAPEHIPNVWKCLVCFLIRIQESESSFEDRGLLYKRMR